MAGRICTHNGVSCLPRKLALAILCLYAQTIWRLPFTCTLANALVQGRPRLKRHCSSILPTKHSCTIAKEERCQWYPQSFISLNPARIRLSASAQGTTAEGEGDSDEGPEDEGEWTCGNVYKDLDRLEQAINFVNAEQNLNHIERMEMLRHFAKARRPFIPDILKFLVFPFINASLVRMVLRNCNKIRLLNSLWGTFVTLMDYQFWTMTIATPIILLVAKRLARRPPEPMPEELISLPQEYLQYITTDWVPPEKSCSDYVLFLLEYWASAVSGMAMLGLALPVTTAFSISIENSRQGSFVAFWLASTQALVRVGAMASLFQFPKQIFRLRRAEQPRPVGFFPTILQRSVDAMIFLFPIGFTCDLSKCLMYLEHESLMALCMSLLTLGIGTWVRLRQRQSTDLLAFAQLERLSSFRKILYACATATYWKKPALNSLGEYIAWSMSRYSWKVQRFLKMGLLAMGKLGVGVLPLLAPIIHIRSLCRLVRIIYTHDLSLALDTEEFRAALENDSEMEQRMMWRHRLEWRDEKRLREVWKEWNSGWAYWWFVKGTTNEKLEVLARKNRERAEMQGNSIIDRLREDLNESSEGNGDFTPREQWKLNAMSRLKQIHQDDYDRKEFEDPLGVAVQQALGIGLGFKYEHFSSLAKGEMPSLRRLQARAAKSAIRRVQELYGEEGVASELERIEDPNERKARALEIRKRNEEEIQYLGTRLTDLVPPPSGEVNKEFQDTIFIPRYQRSKPKFARKSSHEYVVVDPAESASSTERLWEDYFRTKTTFQPKGQHLGSTVEMGDDSPRKHSIEVEDDYSIDDDNCSRKEGKSSDNIERDDVSNGNDEFINAYRQQQRKVRGLRDGDDDDNDDDNDWKEDILLA